MVYEFLRGSKGFFTDSAGEGVFRHFLELGHTGLGVVWFLIWYLQGFEDLVREFSWG